MQIPKQTFMVGEKFLVEVGTDNSSNEKKIEKTHVSIGLRVNYHRGTEFIIPLGDCKLPMTKAGETKVQYAQFEIPNQRNRQEARSLIGYRCIPDLNEK